jgi:hypothetical protein
MSHIESLFNDLSRIAPLMEAVERKDDSKVFYDALSGSLIWSDELPKSAAVSLDCLRFVLRYRTGLIVGEPQPSFELFWRESIRRFPNWIGFSVERTARNEVLADYYCQERKRMEAETE